MKNFSEKVEVISELVGFDPSRDTGYTSRSARRDAKAKLAYADTAQQFSEEEFTRVGAARYFDTVSESRDCGLLAARTPTKRTDYDRRPHRAQPTRRACNARQP